MFQYHKQILEIIYFLWWTDDTSNVYVVTVTWDLCLNRLVFYSTKWGGLSECWHTFFNQLSLVLKYCRM